MTTFLRLGRFLFLLALLIAPAMLAAQDTPVTVAGSGTVMPLFEALTEASGVDLAASVSVTGTNAGLQQFCQGQVDVATASRPLTAAESAACASAQVDPVELLVAHQVLAFVVNPASEFAVCLTSANLNSIFAPSAEGQTTAWNQVDVSFPDTSLEVYVPAEASSALTTLDNLVNGDGIRADAVAGTDADTIAAVSKTEGAIGVVGLAAAEAAGDAVKILQLNTNEVVGCAAPSAENVENRLYGAAADLLVYASRASLEKPGLREVLDYIVSDEAAAVITEQGFVAPTTSAFAANRGVLEGTQGQTFSRGTAQYQIPATLIGSVSIAGSASGKTYLDQVISAMNAAYPGVTTSFEAQGDPAGIRRLCNGEVDLVIVTGDLTDEQTQNCQANNITPLPFELGSRAAVLVANGSSDYLTCLTTGQIAAAWSAGSDMPATWQQVSDQFPETAITLFAPASGNIYSDILLLAATGSPTPMRADTQVNADPLYRAAAAANVEGGLAVMSWSDYQRVLANNQANIQLVSVDSGSGCVAPSLTTIADGSYPLLNSFQLIVSEAALSREEVQSFLWFVYEDSNFNLFDSAGLIGLTFGDLPDVRAALLEAFNRATLKPEAAPDAEATAEATPADEATPEATPAG